MSNDAVRELGQLMFMDKERQSLKGDYGAQIHRDGGTLYATNGHLLLASQGHPEIKDGKPEVLAKLKAVIPDVKGQSPTVILDAECLRDVANFLLSERRAKQLTGSKGIQIFIKSDKEAVLLRLADAPECLAVLMPMTMWKGRQ
jgi:hypothetical protein